jgi:hypothetical protein
MVLVEALSGVGFFIFWERVKLYLKDLRTLYLGTHYGMKLGRRKAVPLLAKCRR